MKKTESEKIQVISNFSTSDLMYFLHINSTKKSSAKVNFADVAQKLRTCKGDKDYDFY